MRLQLQISSIILAIVFVLCTNIKSIIIIDYFLNVSEITELFCINKEKPQLNCNGKCHLKTQIKEVEKNDTKSPFSNRLLTVNFELIPILNSSNLSLTLYELIIEKPNFRKTYNLLSIFHNIPSPPPK